MSPDLSVAPAGQMVQGAGAQLQKSVLYYLLVLKIEDMAMEGLQSVCNCCWKVDLSSDLSSWEADLPHVALEWQLSTLTVRKLEIKLLARNKRIERAAQVNLRCVPGPILALMLRQIPVGKRFRTAWTPSGR